MKTRSVLTKLLPLGAALAILAACLPSAALAVEEEGSTPGLYEDISGGGDSGSAEEPVAPETPDDGTSEGSVSETPDDAEPEPEAPGDAETPGDSVTPGDDANPADGTNPGDSVNPGDSANPGDSVTPGDSVNPGDSANPGDGVNPGGGTNPGDGADPSKPVPAPGTPGGPEDALPPEGLLPEGLLPEVPVMPAAEPLSADTRGRIVLDGCLDDWAEVPENSYGGSSRIDSWKAARDLEGNVYICYTGTAQTLYDMPYQVVPVGVTQNGTTQQSAMEYFSQVFPGGRMVAENLANGHDAAPYYVEAMIPAEYVSGEGCILSLDWQGEQRLVSSLPVLDGEDLPTEEPVYRGIEIDGDFSDWKAVQKVPFADSNGNLESTSFIFDGDDLYIYIKEAPNGDAAAAGSHSTGNYSITTDLGHELKFQLKKENGGSVFGVDGAEARHVGMQWEVRIPASELPYYQESLSFGLYLEEPTVRDVTNLQGGGGNTGSFSGIVIDGSYQDWSSYPHHVIEYATPGTQAANTDSHGALYTEGTTLYGHVATNMQKHLDSWGGDFLAAISIAFNGDREYKHNFEDGNFYPCMVTDDGEVLTERTSLEPGVHTFSICDTRLMGESDRQVFGTMKVTIDPERRCDEMEFELDLEAIAARQNCSVGDLKTIEAQFGRLGQKWIGISGASSGALLGVPLCCAATAGVLFRRRKREEAA